ncbi:hypothetical protein [Nocardia gamkensis]|uniref:Uncharacterized protein n=1 Tax=Nocardia gamkensis TaxID=352869 RepID=A0A7X6R7B8_9NOCA|nr:hypothetical protein [Nocardia gamkensis]NKY31301.1 hypothetical protein [Nocardia gamkensis]NQE72594.1 hypothetical protein [Nocardia gamkensis]
MSNPLDELDKSIAELRRAIRDASAAGDTERVGELRAQLRRTERAWDALLETDEPAQSATMPGQPTSAEPPSTTLPAREHVQRALMLLQTPAAPKLIVDVHDAFFPGDLTTAKLSSLRRDEERSYRAAPGARPYYLCPALNHELLSPARALLTISTWSLEQRIVGPLSPRVNFLTGAIRIAEAIRGIRTAGSEPTPAAMRLLWRFATNIPDAMPPEASLVVKDLDQVIDAALTELEVHSDADHAARTASARRARKQLNDEQQLFGAPLRQARLEQADS